MATFKKFTGRLAGITLAAALLALPGLASATTYYVSTGGNDANDGLSSGTAWKTITHAAATVPAGTSGAPNVITVAAGTYDNTTNGETFPIGFTRSFVSLTGAGAATTIINAQNLNNGLNVDAKSFSVSGLTFRNAPDAIDISEGGFTISNNIFDTTIGQGVNFNRSETDRTTNISFADMSITGNTFKTTTNGIHVDVQPDFDDTIEGLTASFGNFTVSANTFPLTGGEGINISALFYPTDLYNGTVTAGNFTVTGNTVTGGSTGIDFWSGLDYLDNSQATVGNVVVSNNTCTNQSNYGIYLDYWDVNYINDTYFGGTNIVLGRLTVANNTVSSATADCDGIDLSDLGYIRYIYGESTVTTGPISVTGNTVNVDGYGLNLYFSSVEYLGEEYWGDTVAVTMGTTTITGNTITSTGNYGAYIEHNEIAYDTYGQSSVALGPFAFSNNTVNAYSEALYLYADYWGDSMYENSSLVVNTHTFTNNTLTSTASSALRFEINAASYYMYGNASVDIKAPTITNNTLTSNGGDALYFYFDDFAEYMYDNSVMTMSPITVDSNTISATNADGIYIYYYADYLAAEMEDFAKATFPNWIFTDNTIDATGGNYGFYLDNEDTPYDMYDNTKARFGSFLIDGNTFNPDKDPGMDYGIYMDQEYLGYYLYGPATATFGNITITRNTFYAMDSEAIYLYYYEFGYDLTGAPSLTMGDIEIGNNTIDTASWGIDLYFDYLYSSEKAKVNVGKANIHHNTLSNISDYGIYAYYYNENYDPDTATLTIGEPTIKGNTISGTSATDDGIYLDVENSTDGITFGMPTISSNIISGFNQGVYLEDLEEASLNCNFLQNNSLVGMRFNTAGTNFAVHTNALVGNTVGLSVDNGNAAVINAENNWWGDKLGPAACPSCNGVNPGDSGTVDFTPWLTTQPEKSSCGIGFPWIMFTPAITGMGR